MRQSYSLIKSLSAFTGTGIGSSPLYGLLHLLKIIWIFVHYFIYLHHNLNKKISKSKQQNIVLKLFSSKFHTVKIVKYYK